METKVIRYCFRLPGNFREDFKFELNAQNLELKGRVPKCLPPWTKLEFNQCSNCPLDAAVHPHCPLAANIYNIVQRFDGLNSYDEITVEVVTEQRWMAQRTTAQKGISSMMGLVIGKCHRHPGQFCPDGALCHRRIAGRIALFIFTLCL